VTPIATVRVSARVPLPPAAAFGLFTDGIDEWYLRGRDTVPDWTKTVAVRIEPWVGGRLLDVHDASTGGGRAMATVTAWEPPTRLVFTDARGTEVEVTFDAVDGGSRVTLEHRHLDRAASARPVTRWSDDWPTLLRWFERHARSRPFPATDGSQEAAP
jgi:hypothetical protein